MAQGTRFEYEGLGTHWWITVYDALTPTQNEYISHLLEVRMRDFEALYSRFKPTSLISRLSQGETLTNPPSELYELLCWGEKLRTLSKGFFTLGIGLALENLGYDATYSFSATQTQSAVSEQLFVILKPHTIQASPGVRLDLGGIGKGWLIDELARILRDQEVQYFVINGGGDIFATTNQGKPFLFALENPFVAGEQIGHITIQDQAIAASGGQKRRWKDVHTGREHHHLLNPFSGQSSNEKMAVFTQAASARVADAASTILYLVLDEAIESIAQELAVEWLLIFPDGTATRSTGYAGQLNS